MKTIVKVRVVLFALTILLATSVTRVYAQNGRDDRGNNRPHPVEKLTVVDSQGKRVGNVLGFSNSSTLVALTIERTLVVLGVQYTQFLEPDSESLGTLFRQVYFESVNCSGQPFAVGVISDPGFVPMTPRTILDASGTGRLYVQDGSPKTIVAKSVRINSPGGCAEVEFEALATPLRFLTDLYTTFTPPFTLR